MYEISVCPEILKKPLCQETHKIHEYFCLHGVGCDLLCFFFPVRSDSQLSSNPEKKDLQLVMFCRGNIQEQKQLGVTASGSFLLLNVSREN